MITIDQLNQLDREPFVSLLGTAYEHSPWVAARTWPERPFPHLDALIARMRATVDAASDESKLEILRAHPDLAGKLAVENRLTRQSKSEQAGLGLDRLPPEDFAELSELNQRYRAKFGIPFIACVRLLNGIPELLATFRERLLLSQSEELANSLAQVHSIAELRIRDLIRD